MRAADVMRAEVMVLSDEMQVGAAVEALLDRGYGGAPVRDGAGALVGTVTCGDLLRQLEHGRLVRAVTRAAVTISPDEPVISVLNAFVRDRAMRILVRAPDGTLLGIITPTDVCRALAHGRHPAAK